VSNVNRDNLQLESALCCSRDVLSKLNDLV